MPNTETSNIEIYKYGGARALIDLHELHMRSFLKVWQEAKAVNLDLPETTDTDYQSLDHLLHHALRASRSYMVWICEKLELSDPEIKEAPSLETVEENAGAYLDHVLAQWRPPLVNVETARFGEIFTTNWGMELPIEAMLEHAVMHPIRHEHQLKNLLQKQRAN